MRCLFLLRLKLFNHDFEIFDRHPSVFSVLGFQYLGDELFIRETNLITQSMTSTAMSYSLKLFFREMLPTRVHHSPYFFEHLILRNFSICVAINQSDELF